MPIKRTKYCSNKECKRPIVFGSVCSPACAKIVAKPAVKRKPIAKLSVKRVKQNAEYLKIRAKFLVGKVCPITKKPATEVHHLRGRIGALLTDERYFLGVTRKGHQWIEEHPEEAYELGYSLKRNQK